LPALNAVWVRSLDAIAVREPATSESALAPIAIQVSHLRKSYQDTVAVDDVSFEVRRGEIFGVIGPNGAGKTTTVECVCGLRSPDGGTVRVLGLDPRNQRAALRQLVGVQLQEGSLPVRLKVAELVELFASFYPHPADTDELLDVLGLMPKRNAYYGRLSGGQKQRLAIALALVGDPEVAVLDELTTGLDPQARRDTWELIAGVRDRGVTIVLVTHFMDEAERLCDRLALVDGGRIVASATPADMAAQYGGGSELRFRPTEPFDDAVLTVLPEVTAVSHEGDRTVVVGSGDLLGVVVHALDGAGVEPRDAELKTAGLEDAFLRLTSHAEGGRTR
jgi:ABC-2 type transport system ATP-binding protein